jgi:ATP-dependent Lon protease
MKESATIALEYIKANAKLMGLNPEIISKLIFIYMYRKEQHLRRTSAGIAMLTFFSFCFLPRVKKMAMTGEITLEEKYYL